MGELELTHDERRCLQLWFRQAIAKLEQEEVASAILRQKTLDTPGHRNQSPICHRRPIIDRPHLKQLARV